MFMRFAALVLAFSVASLCGASADDLPAPTGDPVLTVSGLITHTNVGDAAQFDRQMLENLDWQEISTFTSFTNGKQKFAGPTLTSLLAAVGASGKTMRATALNDYFVETPVSDAAKHDVLLAVQHNGEDMRVRDRGPIWVVYPLSKSDAAKQIFDTQMIWQLYQIEILP